MKVSVIGLGYIGLPTSLIIADSGIEVLGIDKKKDIIEKLNFGNIHIKEPKLQSLLNSVIKKKTFRATLTPALSDVFIICVPTPFNKNFKPNLSFIRNSIKLISPFLRKGNLILLESTVPVGTTKKISKLCKKYRVDLRFPLSKYDKNKPDVYISHCPERVLPGNIIYEIKNNNRVIGGISKFCSNKAQSFYKKFSNAECIITDSNTAELCKLVENSYRDTNIAFANEISIISEKFNINSTELINIANMHPRVNILKPGPGVGGHCIAVDPWFIVNSAQKESKLIRASREVNNNKTNFVIRKILNIIKKNSARKILFLGLSYKADIDDLRESPALKIVQGVSNKFVKEIYVSEPNIDELPVELSNNKVTLINYKKGIKICNMIVILVSHREFLNINFKKMKNKNFIDTVGIL